jgi:hypothetical protein
MKSSTVAWKCKATAEHQQGIGQYGEFLAFLDRQ